MSVAICILAKDEEQTIARALEQVAQQSLFASMGDIQVHVVANGTTDATVRSAEATRAIVEAAGASLTIHDLEQPGKSRAWNRTVHHLLAPSIDLAIFMDADVELHSDQVFADLLKNLEKHSEAKVCSGYPVKDLSLKPRKSVLDFFSLAVSRQSRVANAINGSLYAARMPVLREIWLPNETPGEDGFLNAMVTTTGFTHPADPKLVRTIDRPTHSFRAHDVKNYLAHERRMIVGTVINCWIFEHLWELRSRAPVGERIRRWNDDDPQWVDNLIRRRVAKRWWVVPSALVFGRLKPMRFNSLRNVAYLPAALAATLLTIPPAFMANRKVKEIGAASTW